MSSSHSYAFLHGGMQGGWVWEETLAALVQQTSNRFGRALVLDVPGCGSKRGRMTDEIELEQVARELVAEIASAQLRDVVLVGHSQAGTVLPLMLEVQPLLFRRAIYVSCIAPPPGQTVLEFSRTALHVDAHEGEVPDVAQLFCNDMSSGAAESFLAKLGNDAWPPSAYTASNWRYDHLGGIAASYVCCLRDATVPLAAQQECAERLRAARLVRIDAGHQVMNTRPHALAEALRHEADADG